MTVAGQTSRLDANEIWEFLFNRTKDAVPEELTNEILADLAAHINKLWIDPLSDQHRREAEAGAPEGWVLVPREPTDEMVRAAMRTDLSYMPGNQGPDRTAVYRAMLAASPSSPASGVRVSDALRGIVTFLEGTNTLSTRGAEIEISRLCRIAREALGEHP